MFLVTPDFLPNGEPNYNKFLEPSWNSPEPSTSEAQLIPRAAQGLQGRMRTNRLISSKYPLFREQNLKLLQELQRVRTEACLRKRKVYLQEKADAALQRLGQRNEELKNKVEIGLYCRSLSTTALGLKEEISPPNSGSGSP